MRHDLLKLALAIIIIRSRRPLETNEITIQRFKVLVDEATIATKAIEAAVDLSARILLDAMLATSIGSNPQLSTEVLGRLFSDVRTQNILQAISLILGLDDRSVCRLLAYCSSCSVPRGGSIDTILLQALEGPGRDVAIRVSALLCHIQGHAPSDALMKKLAESINSTDASLILSGITLVKHLSISESMFSSFLATLSPQRVAYF